MGEIFGQGQNLRPKFLTREIDNEIPFHSTKQEKEKYVNSPNLNVEYPKIVSLKYPPQKKEKKKEKERKSCDLWIDSEFSVKKIIESVPWRAC